MKTSLLRSFLGVLTLASSALSLPPFSSQVQVQPSGTLTTNYTAYIFVQPRDHFDPTSNATFNQRYWFSARHYQKGGPVIVLDSGEDSGENRFPFLDTGILDILSSATNGVGVILEHRYYGAFFL